MIELLATSALIPGAFHAELPELLDDAGRSVLFPVSRRCCGTLGDWEQEILRLEDFDDFPTTFLCDWNRSKGVRMHQDFKIQLSQQFADATCPIFSQWHRVFCLLLLEL